MIISVQFKRKDGEYGGLQYSYLCDVPGVQPGDLVRVSTKDGESIVRVTEIDVPESRIDSRILPILKHILGPADCSCESCSEFTPIGEGDHICGADPTKMPVSGYAPTDDYGWCKGKHYEKN